MILDKSIMYEKPYTIGGQFVLDERWHFQNANEFFYKFLGPNSALKADEIILPEDVEDFRNAMNSVSNDPIEVIVRIKNCEDKYELFLLSINKKINGDGVIYYEIDYYNLINVIKRAPILEASTKKYKRLLGFEKNNYFEYDDQTKEISIYTYVNDQAIIIVREHIDRWFNDCTYHGLVPEKDRNAFDSLYNNLKSGMNDFIIQFSKNVFFETEYDDPISVKGSTVYTEGNKSIVVGSIVSKIDRTENLETAYYISGMSRDSFTGLYNKEAIEKYVTTQIVDNKVDNLYFIMIDIDDFKDINDKYGHLYGDEVIKSLARIIKATLSTRGVCGRFGGDEFVIILENRDENSVKTFLKTVYKNFRYEMLNDEKNHEISLSMGICKYPTDGITYDRLFRIADKCLYIAKEKGKNRYILYDENLHGKVNDDNTGIITDNYKFISVETKTQVTSDIVNELATYGKKSIDDILPRIADVFELDGIHIYGGKDLRLLYQYGNYAYTYDNYKSVVSPEYLMLLGSSGLIRISNYKNIETDCKELSAYMVDSGIKMIFQCVSFVGNSVNVVVSFDVFSRNFKRSDADKSLLSIIGKLMCEILSKVR